MPASEWVPNSKITAFNKANWEKMIKFYWDVEWEINNILDRPAAHVRLDSSLGTGIYPGSQNWPIASALIQKAKAFGGSVDKQYDAMSEEMHRRVTAATAAMDVFEDTDDLNTYSASKLAENFPDMVGGPGGARSTSDSGGSGSGKGDGGDQGGGDQGSDK
jgi:hypothetical protein